MSAKAQDADRRFLELVNENRPRLLKICRVYAWTREDQDDLYQEMLVQIWRSLPRLREGAFANTWLYRTALNTAISFVRKRASRTSKTVHLDHEQIREAQESHLHSMPVENEALHELYEAIARLDGIEKAVVTLFLEDFTHEQIADVLGTNANHVGVMLHRVKKKLAILAREARHE